MRTAEAIFGVFGARVLEVGNCRTALSIERNPEALPAAVGDNLTSQSGGLPKAGHRDIDDHFTAQLGLGFGRTEESTIGVLVRKVSEEFLV